MAGLEKFKKYIGLFLVLLVLFNNAFLPLRALAYDSTDSPDVTTQDAAITDTPTPTPADPTPDISQDPSQDGVTVTPTPSLTPDPVDLDATNSADINNNVVSGSDTGNNSIGSDPSNPIITPTPDPDSNGTSDTTTGTAVSTTQVENDLNTTSVNSSYDNSSLTVVGMSSQNVDYSAPDPNLTPDSTSNPGPTNIDNSADLTNNIGSAAVSGGNTASGSGTITTGDSVSIVSLVNNVDTTLINSTVQIITLNIFGLLYGDIILPDLLGGTCDSCGSGTVNTTNNAIVNNNIDSQATSGQNSIAGSSNAAISTGNANSMVNLVNLVNSTFVGTNAQVIFVNVFGQWNGDFVGWGNISNAGGGYSLAFSNVSPDDSSNCPSCTLLVNINNKATINNDISSLALTGGNSVDGKSGNITTGNAYSLVSVVNLVNTNFINSHAIFGFINIFGILNGDIGGKSNFAALQDNNNNSNSSNSDINNNSGEDQGGGSLEITQSNNVGNHVLPGDTVSFTIDVKNNGVGKVHNAKINLSLIKNGVNTGEATINIGDIEPGRTARITTGLVLSSKTNGNYTAQAIATGNSGGNDLSAVSDSQFLVIGFSNTQLAVDSGSGPTSLVLAASKTNSHYLNKSAQSTNETWILLALMFGYVGIRLLRNPRELYRLKSQTLMENIKTMQKILI